MGSGDWRVWKTLFNPGKALKRSDGHKGAGEEYTQLRCFGRRPHKAHSVLLRFGGTRKCLSSDYSLRKATLIPGSSSAIRGVIVLCPAYIPLSFPGHTSTVDICTVLSAAFSHILTLIGRTFKFLQDVRDGAAISPSQCGYDAGICTADFRWTLE